MISDLDVLKNERINGSEAGISSRLLQGIYGPPDKEKNPVAERKSGGLMANVMESLDEGLYGKEYAKTLCGEDKTETQVADAKVPNGFPAASVVNGENGYIEIAANNVFGDKQDAKQTNDNSVQFLNFLDNRVAA